MSFQSLLLQYSDLEREIRHFFDYKIDLDPFVDFTDEYWVIQDDYLFCSIYKEAFTGSIFSYPLTVFPILSQEHVKKENYLAVLSCKVIFDNIKEKLIVYQNCKKYILLNNDNKVVSDVSRLIKIAEIEF